MDIELLAKQMREKALELKGYNPEEIRAIILEHEEPINRNQELKQLYFHAGRWAGGAKDYGARMAYQNYKRLERPNAS
jgi:hypothetical protein